MVALQKFFLFLILIGTLILGLAATYPNAQSTGQMALVAKIEGAIGPATSRHVDMAIEEATLQNAEVLVLQMNTPGGLVISTREIITNILESPVPIVGYVAPGGAHAASAGTFIIYATHVAGMAPGTNLGAATPVQIGGGGGIPGLPGGEEPSDNGEQEDNGEEEGDAAPTNKDALDRKALNDSIAWIRSLAELRGRNAEWAEKAVREAATLTASEAVAQNVVETVAVDVRDLLENIDGRDVTIGKETVNLETRGLAIVNFEQDFMTKALGVLSNPNVAFLLMLIGIYGLIFEFTNPGSIGPGIVGAISLVLALYALNQLPVDYAGLILILFGIGFMVAEAFSPSFGALGVGGLVAFVIGAAMLIDTEEPAFQISWGLIAGTAAATAGILVFLLGYVWRAHHRPLASGAKSIIGKDAKVLEWSGNEGFVWAAGERWKAKGKGPYRKGQNVKVGNIQGLTLFIQGGTPKRKKRKT